MMFELSSQKSSLQRVVFWEPSVSPHKSGLFEALALHLPNVEIICVADSDLQLERKSQGWISYQPIGYKLLISPSDEICSRISTEFPKTTLHIFSGIRHYRCIVTGLRGVKSIGAQFGIMSEPRVDEGGFGKLRFIQSWISEGWIRSNVSFVLAIGRNGPAWFESVGYDSTKIFPFAYFVDKPLSPSNSSGSRELIAVGYLGRIISMKGIEYLSDVILGCDSNNFVFRIAGVGDKLDYLREKTINAISPVFFEGAIPMSGVYDFLGKLDVLVLPSISKDDGWGVVVSESLLAGTAVVATSCVGASILLDKLSLGRCIKPRSAICISDAINSISKSDGFSEESRVFRRQWAERHLSSEAGALNLIDIINFSIGRCSMRPLPFFYGD